LLMVIVIIVVFKLVLSEFNEEKRKEIGENVFLDNLPLESEVYLLYYSGAMPDKELENRLRALGESAGNNLFVNIGRLNDPSFRKIANKFDIKDFPVIIITANSRLASHPVEFETAYVKLDSKKLLKNPDLAIDCVQKLFLLFIQGEISEALKQPGVYDRRATVARINSVVSGALKGVEFSITMLGGTLGVKWQG
jgi:hypothetical protein